MNDWRGTPIEIGSRIVFATSQSNNISVTEGEVLEIEPKFRVRRIRRVSWGQTYNETGTTVLQRLERVTVVHE